MIHKLQILSSPRKAAWDAFAPLFPSLNLSRTPTGEAGRQRGSFLDLHHNQNEIWLSENFPFSLTVLILKDKISSSVMPTGKSKALKNSLKVQKAFLLPTAFEECLQCP